ncbi:MAG: LytTR family DNA-binding domain-containing protein [bacterium]|nr:LytTR family DNA-binding domain-containing protein [bacterium]
MYVAICDDEIEYIKILEEFLVSLQKVYQGLKYKVFKCAEEVLEYYKRNGNKFDILITDIEMKDVSGVELANTVRSHDRNVIIFFLTSYREYAIQCFRAEPLNFWVKPLSYDVMREDFKRAYSRIIQSQEYITIVENRKVKEIRYDDIVYFEAWGKKTLIHTVIGEYTTNKSLSKFKEELDSNHFVRVSQTYIVNFAYVKNFSDKSLEMNGVNGSILIGRTYQSEWKKGMIKYKRRRLLDK